MTSQYADFTSYVSSASKANDYSSLSQYEQVGQDVPMKSLLKLSAAPGSVKYFSAASDFGQRLDSVRISPPAKTPVQITSGGGIENKMLSAEGIRIPSGSDYASFSNAYTLN